MACFGCGRLSGPAPSPTPWNPNWMKWGLCAAVGVLIWSALKGK